MKRFVTELMRLKTAASFAFAAQILIFALVGLLTGRELLCNAVVLQSLGVGVATALLQFLFFTEALLKRMLYSLRVTLFALALYAVLAGCALAFGWFPAEPGYFASFTLAFLVMLAFMTAIFQIYFCVTGNRYDQSLNAYRRRLEEGHDEKG